MHEVYVEYPCRDGYKLVGYGRESGCEHHPEAVLLEQTLHLLVHFQREARNISEEEICESGELAVTVEPCEVAYEVAYRRSENGTGRAHQCVSE